MESLRTTPAAITDKNYLPDNHELLRKPIASWKGKHVVIAETEKMVEEFVSLLAGVFRNAIHAQQRVRRANIVFGKLFLSSLAVSTLNIVLQHFLCGEITSLQSGTRCNAVINLVSISAIVSFCILHGVALYRIRQG